MVRWTKCEKWGISYNFGYKLGNGLVCLQEVQDGVGCYFSIYMVYSSFLFYISFHSPISYEMT